MAENINRDNIDDIVNGVREALKTGADLDDGVSLEFFEDDGNDTMLVFEDDEESTAPEAAQPVIEEPTVEIETSQDSEPDAELEKPKEESFSQDKIWTTYVPKFTGASENYRMKRSGDAPAVSVSNEKRVELKTPVFVSDTTVHNIDPTAELDSEESIAGATLVSSGNAARDISDISKVFKFESAEPSEKASVTEEEVIDHIDKLLGLIPEEKDEDVAIEPQAEEITEASEPEDAAMEEEAPIPVPVSVSAREPLAMEKTAAVIESVDESVRKKKSREYTALSEKDKFIDTFIDSITSIRVRVLTAALLAVILLFVENASYLGVNIVKFLHLEGIGGGMAIITMPFIVGLFLLSLPEVAYSFASLTMGKVIPELFITVSFSVLSVYYGTVIAFSSSSSYVLLGFVFAVLVIFVMLSSYYKKKAEFISFKIISDNGEKRVVDRKLTRNLPEEHRALDGIVESYKSRTARVFNTGFVSDFCARSSVISENGKANMLILAVSLGVALVGGIFAFFIPGGIVSAAKTFALAYTLALPSFVFISHKMLYSQAANDAYCEKSAFIGEKSIFDYSGVDVITFDDTEIFGKEDVNLQRIIYGNGRQENLPKAFAQMSALFTVVGGPLAYIFADAVDRRVSPADNVAVDTDGIIGEIDGVVVMAGSAAFMRSHGLEIPADLADEGTSSQSTRVMYAAENGTVYAKFFVRYMLSEEFTMILPLLLDDKIKPLVYTRDPNVDDSLFRALTAGTDYIRVLKKKNLPSSEVRLYNRISLGMASTGDKTNIINTLLLSKRYASLHAKLSIMELPVAISGAILGLLLSLLVKSSIPSLFISLWYVGWIVGVILTGKKLFGRKKEKNKDKDQ